MLNILFIYSIAEYQSSWHDYRDLSGQSWLVCTYRQALREGGADGAVPRGPGLNRGPTSREGQG